MGMCSVCEAFGGTVDDAEECIESDDVGVWPTRLQDLNASDGFPVMAMTFPPRWAVGAQAGTWPRRHERTYYHHHHYQWHFRHAFPYTI